MEYVKPVLGLLVADLIAGMTMSVQDTRYSIEQCIRHPAFLQLQESFVQLALDEFELLLSQCQMRERCHLHTSMTFSGSDSYSYSLSSGNSRRNVSVKIVDSRGSTVLSAITSVDYSIE
jgi:hypothetical protein